MSCGIKNWRDEEEEQKGIPTEITQRISFLEKQLAVTRATASMDFADSVLSFFESKSEEAKNVSATLHVDFLSQKAYWSDRAADARHKVRELAREICAEINDETKKVVDSGEPLL